MRALVIGGGGFLGTYTTSSLTAEGDEVCIFDQKTYPQLGNGVTAITGDVRDRDQLEAAYASFRPDVVVHMASIVNPQLLRKQPMLAYEVNTSSVVTALDLSVKFGVGRFVYVSSISAVAPGPQEPITADAPLVNSIGGSTLAFYGTSKAAAECWVLGFREVFDLDVRVVRPSAVYGHGMQYGMGIRDIVEGAVAGEAVTISEGAWSRRDYTHVADVASLVVRCAHAQLESDAPRIFYGATGSDPVDLFELREVVLRVVPDAHIVLEGELTEHDARENSFRGRLDVETARKYLSWVPKYVELERGVRDYVNALRRVRAES